MEEKEQEASQLCWLYEEKFFGKDTTKVEKGPLNI